MTGTILEALDAHAGAAPASLAVDELSYRDLQAASLRVATQLRRSGIRTGDRIVLYAENGHAFIYAYLGALRAGAVVVPANVLYRASDLSRVLDDSGASLIVTSELSRAFVPGSISAATLDLCDVAAWARDASLDDASQENVALAAPLPGDLAVLIYTSGTTGRAKGAMLTHGNLRAIADAVVAAWRWTSRDVLLLTLPLFHVHGLGAGLNGTLVAGARMLLRERFDADDVLATLGRGDATMFFGVPTMYVRLLENAGAARFERVRLFVSGSAALPASVHASFDARFGTSILERYGSTEFGFALTNRYDGPRYAGTVGFPFPGVSVRLIDNAQHDVAAGSVGEIAVNGPIVCAGYWQNSEATAAAFFHDSDGRRWYRSGDLATFDPQRGYAIVGRTKELIISGGFNIYPREIEDELVLVPGVRAAAVLGRPDAARGEVPVAFLETDEDADLDAILLTLRSRLASFKVPKVLYRIDALPRNAMGKTDKPSLCAVLAEQTQPH